MLSKKPKLPTAQKQRMKHNFRRIFPALLLILALLLSGCGDSNTQLLPMRTTIEKSENSYGARYIFTLQEFSRQLTGIIDDSDLKLKEDQWESITDDLVDDNGVRYSSYCYRAGSVTFTVAAENESGKLMNIGCGCDSTLLEDASFRNSYIRLCAALAQYAGGYEDNSVDFFVNIYITLLDGDNDTLSYGESLYIKSIDDTTTVLMTAPCSDDIKQSVEIATG